MVEAGFLDPEIAAATVNDSLVLASGGHEGASGSWRAPYFVSEVSSFQDLLLLYMFLIRYPIVY